MKFPTRQALGPRLHIQDLEPEKGAGHRGWESSFQGAPPRRPREAQAGALGGRRSANLGKGPPRLRDRLSGGCLCRSPPQGPRRARRRLLGSVHIVPAFADRPHHPQKKVPARGPAGKPESLSFCLSGMARQPVRRGA